MWRSVLFDEVSEVFEVAELIFIIEFPECLQCHLRITVGPFLSQQHGNETQFGGPESRPHSLLTQTDLVVRHVGEALLDTHMHVD